MLCFSAFLRITQSDCIEDGGPGQPTNSHREKYIADREQGIRFARIHVLP